MTVPLDSASRPDGLVSVITIFLDEERFLAEAVESVLAQTYPHWELLLCDDGSTDRSSELARDYARRHPGRIRYLEHPGHENRGMSATRNLGLAHARGELIAFIDGDDVWLPEKLARQVDILDRYPRAAMVYGPSLLWHGWTGDPADATRDVLRELGVRPDRVYAGPTLLARTLRGLGEPPSTCGALIRRDALDSVGGFENAFRGLHEDQAFFAKLFLHHDVFVMSESLDLYRQHPDSACHVAERAGEFDREHASPSQQRFLQWLLGYVIAHRGGAAIEGVIRRELWLYRHPAFATIRSRWRHTLGSSYALAVRALFAVGRRALPASMRQALWTRWNGRQTLPDWRRKASNTPDAPHAPSPLP